MERRRLGRGLDALVKSAGAEESTAAPAGVDGQVAVGLVDPNPFQPRKAFDNEELAALSASIRNHGILQPLVVRAVDGRYQLIAGERRLRAAQAAGLAEVPVRIVDFNERQVLEAALVENIQRTDLNPIEKAMGFQDYLQRFGVKQEELATRLGLDRSTLTNLLRLLDCPPEIQDWVRTGLLAATHARALLGLPDAAQQVAAAKDIISRGLSVRATEAMVREKREQAIAEVVKPAGPEKSSHVQGIEDDLRKRLGSRVEIRLRKQDRGFIVLTFTSNDEFERLVEHLRK